VTELLRQAIAQIEQLSPDQQDAIAARFLAELQDEQTRSAIEQVSMTSLCFEFFPLLSLRLNRNFDAFTLCGLASQVLNS
jgi:hypothetical protein